MSKQKSEFWILDPETGGESTPPPPLTSMSAVGPFGSLHAEVASSASDVCEVMGENMSIIGTLSYGWRLVAHANGPAITNPNGTCLISPAYSDAELPDVIRRESILSMMSWMSKQANYPSSKSDNFPQAPCDV